MTERLILHEYSMSGNCYKVRLTAACVGTHIERREYDIMKGETRTTQFLWDVNPNGRIPVLQVDQRFIPESNAACYYIADGSNLIPTERFDHADMLRFYRDLIALRREVVTNGERTCRAELRMDGAILMQVPADNPQLVVVAEFPGSAHVSPNIEAAGAWTRALSVEEDDYGVTVYRRASGQSRQQQ